MADDDRAHIALWSRIAELEQRIQDGPAPVTITIGNVIIFNVGGKEMLDFTPLANELTDNTSVSEIFETVLPGIADLIDANKGNQAKLDELTATLRDSNSREKLVAQAYKNLIVAPPAVLSATFNGPGAATVGTAYTGAAIAAGGTAPYSFTGTGPAWLTFAADGSASGTPDAAGDAAVSGNVTDAAGASASFSGTITVS